MGFTPAQGRKALKETVRVSDEVFQIPSLTMMPSRVVMRVELLSGCSVIPTIKARQLHQVPQLPRRDR